MSKRTFSLLGLLLVLLGMTGLTLACGGGGGSTPPPPPPAPIITSFTIAKSILDPGGSTQLTAVFANGTGSVSGGVGAVTSGTAVTVTPAASTTYTLTVTGASQSSVTQAIAVAVRTPPWASYYNGPANGDDVATRSYVDKSGNVYVSGNTQTATGYAALVIKYNTEGVQQWTATYEGGEAHNDTFWDVAVDSNGDVIAAGASFLNDGTRDAILLKYNAAGTLLWMKSFDGAAHLDDYFGFVTVDGSNNILVGGSTENRFSLYGAGADFLAAKYGADGSLKWQRSWNGAFDNYDYPYAIATDGAGNFYLTGITNPTSIEGSSSDDYGTLKYDTDGNLLWAVTYHYPGYQWVGETPHSIAIDSKGNVIVTGWASDYMNGGAVGAALTIKYSATGVEQWVNRYKGPTIGSNEGGAYVGVDKADNIYVAGTLMGANYYYVDPATNEHYYYADMFALKYAPDGTQQWVTSFGTATFDRATNAVVDQNGTLTVTGLGGWDIAATVATGKSNWDAYTAQLDANGVLLWSTTHNSPQANLLTYHQEYPLGVGLDANGNVYTTDWVYNDPATPDTRDIVTIKNVNLLPTGLIAPQGQVSSLLPGVGSAGQPAVQFNRRGRTPRDLHRSVPSQGLEDLLRLTSPAGMSIGTEDYWPALRGR